LAQQKAKKQQKIKKNNNVFIELNKEDDLGELNMFDESFDDEEDKPTN